MPPISFSHLLLGKISGPVPRTVRRGQIVPVMDKDTVLVVSEGALAVEFAHRDTESLIVDVVNAASGVVNCRSLCSLGQGGVVRALLPSSYLRVPLSQFTRAISEHHDLACAFAEQMCDRVGELRARIAVLDEPNVRRRVLHALLYLHEKLGTPCELSIGQIVQVSQSVIGATAGISRQTANRVLRDLQSDGLIRIERSMICLLDLSDIDRLSRGLRMSVVHRPCGSCRLVRPQGPFDCATRRPNPASLARRN